MSDIQNELVTVATSEVVNVDIATLNRVHTQLRCKMDPETVTRYAEKYEIDEDGELVTPLPPIVVFKDGKGEMYLADGFHRCAAAKQIGFTSMMAEVREGTLKDAILYAAGCNDKNGLTWTNKDKKNAVTRLLNRWPKMSNHKIASYCCCSHVFVCKVRKENDPDEVGKAYCEAKAKAKELQKTQTEKLQGLLQSLSAGIVEGFNNKLKLIARKSYGFRTQEAYETALYHNLGALPEPEFTHEFC